MPTENKMNILFTSFKYIAAMLYSAFISVSAMQVKDSYEAVFSDVFFYIAGALGTALMLLVEKADNKSKEKVTPKRVAYSIVACVAIVYLSGTVRASMIADEDFERNHWFYGIVMFACAVAPEFVRALIGDGGKYFGDAAKRGLARKIESVIAGDSEAPQNVEPENSNNNEQ